MTPETFDSFSRLAARRTSRRSTLRAAALGAVAVATTRPARATAQTSDDAGALVQRLYEEVNAYRYDQAYALLGARWRGRQSLGAFTAGYANTAFVQCEVSSAERADDRTTEVAVRLVSWHNDAKIVAYEGAYTVGTEAGQPVILAGDNRPTLVPPGTPPLCAVADLAVALGPWDAAAGSRNGAVVGTNTGARACVVGGSPRVELSAGGQVLRSTSQEGSPPIAIVLEPGGSALAPLRFANWCGDASGPASVTVELPGAPDLGTVDTGDEGISYPPCLGEGQAALLEIRGWTSAR